MASASQTTLKSAAMAANTAIARLEAAVEAAAAERAAAAQVREAVQAELTAGWQTRVNQLEAALAEARGESEFLKHDNQRLSNQLHQLQQEHLDLQSTASSTLTRLNASVSQLDLLLEQSA